MSLSIVDLWGIEPQSRLFVWKTSTMPIRRYRGRHTLDSQNMQRCTAPSGLFFDSRIRGLHLHQRLVITPPRIPAVSLRGDAYLNECAAPEGTSELEIG